jgi:hypothetical protein
MAGSWPRAIIALLVHGLNVFVLFSRRHDLCHICCEFEECLFCTGSMLGFCLLAYVHQSLVFICFTVCVSAFKALLNNIAPLLGNISP